MCRPDCWSPPHSTSLGRQDYALFGLKNSGDRPGWRDQCPCGANLSGDGLDFVDDAEVLLEVALGEVGDPVWP
jgi:hypothetical protein